MLNVFVTIFNFIYALYMKFAQLPWYLRWTLKVVIAAAVGYLGYFMGELMLRFAGVA